MEITHHEGPSGNKYWKIHAGKKEYPYDVDGILEQDRNNQEERQDLLLQIIARNNGIKHTHVIHLAQKFGFTSKITIEKELKNLESMEFIESEKIGDSANAMRLWSIKRPEHNFEKGIKKETKKMITHLDAYIKSIKRNFKQLNEFEKDMVITNLLSVIHGWQPIIGIFNQETKINKEKKIFDSLVAQAYDMLKKHNKRDFIDGRHIMTRMLHQKINPSVTEMLNYLDVEN